MDDKDTIGSCLVTHWNKVSQSNMSSTLPTTNVTCISNSKTPLDSSFICSNNEKNSSMLNNYNNDNNTEPNQFKNCSSDADIVTYNPDEIVVNISDCNIKQNNDHNSFVSDNATHENSCSIPLNNENTIESPLYNVLYMNDTNDELNKHNAIYTDRKTQVLLIKEEPVKKRRGRPKGSHSKKLISPMNLLNHPISEPNSSDMELNNINFFKIQKNLPWNEYSTFKQLSDVNFSDCNFPKEKRRMILKNSPYLNHTTWPYNSNNEQLDSPVIETPPYTKLSVDNSPPNAESSFFNPWDRKTRENLNESPTMSPLSVESSMNSNDNFNYPCSWNETTSPRLVHKFNKLEKCILCGESGQSHSTAVICCRQSCQRLFCKKCISYFGSNTFMSVFSDELHECIVCVYQAQKRAFSDESQWHSDFRDDCDGQFVRMLRDSLPYSNGLFIEISKTRQPCWRRKLDNGTRKHFSFRFYGGIFESRLEALEINKLGLRVSYYVPSELHSNPYTEIPKQNISNFSIYSPKPMKQQLIPPYNSYGMHQNVAIDNIYNPIVQDKHRMVDMMFSLNKLDYDYDNIINDVDQSTYIASHSFSSKQYNKSPEESDPRQLFNDNTYYDKYPKSLKNVIGDIKDFIYLNPCEYSPKKIQDDSQEMNSINNTEWNSSLLPTVTQQNNNFDTSLNLNKQNFSMCDKLPNTSYNFFQPNVDTLLDGDTNNSNMILQNNAESKPPTNSIYNFNSKIFSNQSIVNTNCDSPLDCIYFVPHNSYPEEKSSLDHFEKNDSNGQNPLSISLSSMKWIPMS